MNNKPATPNGLVIAIVSSGWVFLGEKDDESSAGVCTMRNASVIRRWGTTKGLGEIAFSGPTKETVLDACGTVRITTSNLLATIDCQYKR